MTGGTITKTGDEKFIVGHNNGVGVVAQSGGAISITLGRRHIQPMQPASHDV
jgi:hypothetical protein